MPDNLLLSRLKSMTDDEIVEELGQIVGKVAPGGTVAINIELYNAMMGIVVKRSKKLEQDIKEREELNQIFKSFIDSKMVG